ncbi:MAG: MFS transporter [Caldilineaceae bacterium]|nr:MFS transporter [Caldilineaceae bacterium]
MSTHAHARTRWAVDRRFIAPKAYYFSYYAAMAGLMPFLVLYYRQVGLNGGQIGLLAGLPPFLTWLAAPLWGALADATQRHRQLMVAANVGAIAAVLGLAQAQSLRGLLPLVMVYAIFNAPLMPLVDNSVMALLGERSADYGKQRLWGAVGWGVAGGIAGLLVDRWGISFSFFAFAVWMALGLAVALRLPISHAAIGRPFWVGLAGLLRDRRLAVFLITMLMAGIGMSTVNSFLFLYLEDLGARASLMGLSLTIATLSELPVFFFSGLLLHRWGARVLLLLSLTIFVLRLAIYAAFPLAEIVLAANLLHGLTFSASWVAGVTYANQIAPPGLGATAQGLFSGVTMGLGAALGALTGGLLYETAGPGVMYGVVAVCVAAGVLFFALAERRPAQVS